MVQLMCWILFTLQRPLAASAEAAPVTGLQSKGLYGLPSREEGKSCPFDFGLLSEQADINRLFSLLYFPA